MEHERKIYMYKINSFIRHNKERKRGENEIEEKKTTHWK